MADGSTDRTTRGPGSGRTGLEGEKVNAGAFPSPLRHFLAQPDQLRSAGTLDMDQVRRLLVELAADEEYLGPVITAMPSASAGEVAGPARTGSRLVLFHRPEGVMAYTHSHQC